MKSVAHTHRQTENRQTDTHTPADSHGAEDWLQPREDHLPGGAVPVGDAEPQWQQGEEDHNEGDREGHLDCSGRDGYRAEVKRWRGGRKRTLLAVNRRL